MKNFKRLVAVFIMAALFSTSFTSCVDNDVDPAVEAIYKGQADLIAAQVALKQAEAGLLDARAAAELALAEYRDAQTAQVEALTAGIEIENAQQAAVYEQELLLLIAQTSADVAAAEQAAAIAEAEFELEMMALMAQIEAAGVEIATEYAYRYHWAMEDALDILEDWTEAKDDLAEAMLMQTYDPDLDEDVSWEYYLAKLQDEVDYNTAQIEFTQGLIDALVAANGDIEGTMDDLRAQLVDLEAAEDEIDIMLQEKYNEIMALYDENDSRGEFLDRMDDQLDDHNDAVDEKNDRLDWIENAEKDIALWTAAIADYDAALAALQADFDAAEAAALAAQQALGNTNEALEIVDAGGNKMAHDGPKYYTVDADGDAFAAGGTKYDDGTLLGAYADAHIDYLDAKADLAALETEIGTLYAAFQTAITTLANEQAIYDAGISGVESALASAQADLTAAEAALVLAQAEYDAAKAEYEADPTGFSVTDGPDDVVTDLGELGIVGDVSTRTYMWITSFTETFAGSGFYIPATVEGTKIAENDAADFAITILGYAGDPFVGGEAGAEWQITDPSDIILWEQDGDANTAGGGALAPTPTLTAAQVQAATSVPGNIDVTTAYLIEVETDDTSYSYKDRFNAAVAALGNEDIFDNPPMIDEDGDPANSLPIGEMGAWADLWNAQMDVLVAQHDLDNFGNDLEDAQKEYDYWKNLYENQLPLLEAAQQDVADATDAKDDAQVDADDAWDELGPVMADVASLIVAGGEEIAPEDTDPTDSLGLSEIWVNAGIALLDFQVCDVDCLTENIAAAEANIAQWTQEIANIQPIIDAKYAEVASLLGQLAELGVEIEFTVNEDGTGEYEVINAGELSSLYPDIHAAIIVAWQEYWDLEQELTANENQQDAVEDLLDAYEDHYEWSYFDELEDLQEDLAKYQEDLAVAQAALASAEAGMASDEVYIAYLEAKVDALEQSYLNALAIAEEWKALMEAALS